MEIHNPKTLPEELIKICNYYAETTRRPFDILSFVGDPSPDKENRRGICGQYIYEPNRIFIYLARIQNGYGQILNGLLPPGLGEWLSVLEVFLHEFGHHIQREHLDYRYDYNERGYWDSWPEHNARDFAYREIHRLATLDKNLFAPWYTRELGYLGIYASHRLRHLWETRKTYPRARKFCVLREARLRAIHIGKYINAKKEYTITKEELAFYPDYFSEDYPAPEPIADTEMGYTPSCCNELAFDDYPPEIFDVAYPDDIPEPEDFEDVYLGQSGLYKKRVQYHKNYEVKVPNPLAKLAENEGIVWSDKLGRKWRYLGLGQAIDCGLLENDLSPD